jgi:broad specificity phosphatase PhoE
MEAASPRLVLVRHGPSAHAGRVGLVDRRGVERWRDAYDAAGILEDARAPARLVALAEASTHVVSSDMPRAAVSAARLAPSREVRLSALMRESPLPIPPWPTRLPLVGWATLIHLGWSWRLLRGIELAESERARALAAARWLDALVTDGGSALVVTHGVFRTLLSGQLAEIGWHPLGREGGYRHWSAWSFAGPTGPVARASG